jgi:hypothetical protein
MTNTKKKNGNKRKLLGAVGMLTVSAAMLVSSTFAWFSLNKTVQVTNMRVQARADQGLLINEVATAGDSNWDELATTNQTTGIQLHATSTADTKTWYVAYSKKSNTAAAATEGAKSNDLTSDGYKTLGTDFTTAVSTVNAIPGSNAKQEITYVDKDAGSDYDPGEGYYVKYTYYLKSSADEITCSLDAGKQSLQIKNVTVADNTNTGVSGNVKDLDAALRVAIVINNNAYIYAPVTGATTSYYVNAGSTATTTLTGDQATAMTKIPSVTESGTPVYVYLYFEGEDAELKTDNVTSALDNVTVSFDLSLVDNTTAATNNGVAVPTT